MKLYFCLMLMLCSPLTNASPDQPSPTSSATTLINAVLDDFHLAAEQADTERYLAHFSGNAVFIGTDDWERWPIKEFRAYVEKHFKDGSGWAYQPLSRHITLADDGETAWIDELTQSPKWGRFRGNAVLIKQDDAWKVAHYSLSMLIPNAAWEEISKIATDTYQKSRAEGVD